MDTATPPLRALMTVNPVRVSPAASMEEALRRMEERGFRHLPVTDGDQVVGLLTDRDLRRATSLLSGGGARSVASVREVMSAGMQGVPGDRSAAQAVREMLVRQTSALLVVEQGRLLGIVTETDLMRAFVELCDRNGGACDDLARYHMMRPLTCVPPDMEVERALWEMNPREGHLGVSEAGHLLGFLSERDLLVGLARTRLGGRAGGAPRVAQLMSSDIQSAAPGDGLCACARRMMRRRLSALTVFDEDHPVGVITQRGVLEYFDGLVSS